MFSGEKKTCLINQKLDPEIIIITVFFNMKRFSPISFRCLDYAQMLGIHLFCMRYLYKSIFFGKYTFNFKVTETDI